MHYFALCTKFCATSQKCPSSHYTTKWALGIEGNQFSDTDKRLYLGYHEATCMDLTGRKLESEGFNEERSVAMHHTYEISLLAPREELRDIYEGIHPLHESEGMMRGANIRVNIGQ